MNAEPVLYRVITIADDGSDPQSLEIMTRRGPGGAAGAAMALLTEGGTRPTSRRVHAVVELGRGFDVIGAHLG